MRSTQAVIHPPSQPMPLLQVASSPNREEQVHVPDLEDVQNPLPVVEINANGPEEVAVLPIIDPMEVSEIGNASISEEDLHLRMLNLIEMKQLLLSLHQELVFANMQELVATPRWIEIQVLMQQIEQRFTESNLENGQFKTNYFKLKKLMERGFEWQRYMQNPEIEPAPFRGYARQIIPANIARRLPLLLSAVREEIRKPPAEIDLEFVDSLIERLEDLDDDSNNADVTELDSALSLAKDLKELDTDGFLQRIERSEDLERVIANLDGLFEELSPDRLETLVTTPRWNEIVAELDALEDEIEPDQLVQLQFLYGDRLEIIYLMEKVGKEWKRYQEILQEDDPYELAHVNVAEISPAARDLIWGQVLSAVREQVRTAPPQIDLERLHELEGVVNDFRRWALSDFYDVPWNFNVMFKSIKLVKSLKELHSEGYFQGRQMEADS